MPEPNFPDLDLPADPIPLSDSEIEQAAEDVRRYWRMGDGPIANMILLLENQGAIVGRDRLGADTLDGVSQVDTQGRPHAMIAMMIFRAHDAGLMSEDTERKLRIGISRNKWRITEPYDETTEPEEPRVCRHPI